MADMTPIRIRGKRNATKAEKWHAGKKRRATRASSPASSVRSSTAVATSWKAGSGYSRKRQRYTPELSRLEQLPTEILQDIFDYSANLNLPLVSKGLLSQLSSPHVHLRLTSRILRTVLHTSANAQANDADLETAQRLLNTHFMTFDFFKSWVHEECKTESVDHCDSSDLELRSACRRWAELRPSQGLLPPRSALRGPFRDALRQDRLNFLHLFAHFEPDMINFDTVHAELAYEGLSNAIDDSEEDAVRWLLKLGLRPNTEHVRQAVVDKSCNLEIVAALLRRSMRLYETALSSAREQGEDVRLVKPGIDYLDTALWSWAERSRMSMIWDDGENLGDWLLYRLKRDSLRVEQLLGDSVVQTEA